MPRVDRSYLDARRREILSAAHRCFARDGFQATTMQDVADEVDLSVGALYRYFDGKEALVEALAEWGRAQKREVMDDVASPGGAEGLAELVVQLAASLPASEQAGAAVRFDVRIWGEALGQPNLESLVRDSLSDFRRLIADYVEDARAEGRMRADVEPETAARVLVSLLTGLELQLAFEPDLDREAYAAAVGALLEALRSGDR